MGAAMAIWTVLVLIGSSAGTCIDCYPGACDNGGTCVEGLGDIVCVCPPGFKGERCQIAPCREDYDPPLYGAKVCALTGDTTVCTVHCKDNNEFAILPAQAYTCQADGQWFADSVIVPSVQSSPWPDCTGRYRPGRPHMLGAVHYFGTDCPSSMGEIISNFQQLFSYLQFSPGQPDHLVVQCGGTA